MIVEEVKENEEVETYFYASTPERSPLADWGAFTLHEMQLTNEVQ